MKKTFSKKKSAFSLIELSIVLIVIGLLIAGITGGASLIKSSELRSVMGEARGYAVAVNAFYSQFNMLPGDYDQVIGTSVAGNKNGNIEYYGTGPVSESSSAWQALKAIGAVDAITVGAPDAATVAPTFGTNAPSSKIKSSGWAFDYRTFTEGNNTAANQNVVVLTGAIGTAVTAGSNTLVQGTNVAKATITGADALSIDSKIDDGSANLGKVRGLNAGSATDCYTASSTASATYKADGTGKVCALTYQVDVNS